MKQVYSVVLLAVVLLAHQALARELSPIGPINELKDCEWMCLAVYSPVCGSDGNTYSNYCTFGIAQCKHPSLKLKHPGGCETSARDAHLGDDDKLEEVPNLNPQMFVKCEELGGECVFQGDQVLQCSDGSSTDNDGKCFFREMVCCAPAMKYSTEEPTTEGTDVTESSRATDETDIGHFVRIEEEFLQNNSTPWMPAVKCGELEGECLHHHHAKRHCKAGKSIENDGNCPNKMVCCAPDIGQFVRIEEELFQNNSTPWMPAVKCGELEGECLHHHHAKRHCRGGKSLENDGNCPNKMVCCAPVMTYLTTTEGTDGTDVED